MSYTGGTAQTPGMHDRLQAELDLLFPQNDANVAAKRVQPVVLEGGWSGASLIGSEWEWQSLDSDTAAAQAAAKLSRHPAHQRGYQPTWAAETGGGTYIRASTIHKA